MPPRRGGPPPAGSTGNIAQDAAKYAGLGYVWGGRADRPGDWDCSSFVSYVLGHDLGLRLPGGGRYGDPGYPPHSHGPVAAEYAGWAGAVAVPGPPLPGDLCCWQTHIGIATSGTRMVSALNPQLGTMISDISSSGPAGESVAFRRVTGAPGGPPVAGGGGAGAGAGIGAGALTGLVLVSAVALLLLLGAAAAGLLGGAAVTAVVASVSGDRTKAEQ